METVGFPSCGSVTIFIERRRGHVDFTLGPFKGGVFVSHKLIATVIEEENGINGVKLVDVVHLLNRETSNEFGWHCTQCSCVETMKNITRRCTSPSIDGYVSQTLLSMENLYYLCERHGGICYPSLNGNCSLDQNVSCCFENDLAARIPLLG
jgi:hypothetical protein